MINRTVEIGWGVKVGGEVYNNMGNGNMTITKVLNNSNRIRISRRWQGRAIAWGVKVGGDVNNSMGNGSGSG